LRPTLFLAALLAAAPALAQSDGARAAVDGLENVAREICNHRSDAVDPAGLAAAIDGPLGDAMGLRDGDTIIGMIYVDNPEGGAQMWASTMAGRNGGCALLIDMLSLPVDQVLADLL
jgi:hypothetical protein